jgi:precorrin-6B methylase 2
LIDNLKIKRGTAVLDVGTGAGTLAVHAARAGAGCVVAVDRNPNAVRAAQTNGERLVKAGTFTLWSRMFLMPWTISVST